MMKLDALAIANSSGIVTAAVFTLCALLLAVAPAAAYAGFSYLFHVELGKIAYTMSWGVFAGGLITWVAGVWLLAGALAWFYNRFAGA